MTTLPMDGKGVFLTRVQRFKYGHKVGYKVYTEYDGFESVTFEEFWELEAMLEASGHAKPDRLHGHVTDLNHIKAELTVMDNSYRVNAIYASDGTKVTREQVVQAQANKRAQLTRKVPKTMHQLDTEVHEWLSDIRPGIAPLIADQYRKPARKWNFKRVDGGMHVMFLKARGQLFVPVAVQPAA